MYLQTFAQLSSHQLCTDDISVHTPLAQLGHQGSEPAWNFGLNFLHSLVYFCCGHHTSLAVHFLTWLWELGLPFPKPLWDSLKCLIFCAEVSQLFQVSDAVCGTECWEQSKETQSLKGEVTCKWDFSCQKGLMIGALFCLFVCFLIFLLAFKLQAPCKLCFVLHMHGCT